MTATSVSWQRRSSDITVPLVPLTSEEFAAVLRDLRRQRRLSQDDAARLVGVSARTYSRWEGGKVSPHISNLDKAITGFNVSPTVFLGEPEITPGDLADHLAVIAEVLEGVNDKLAQIGDPGPLMAASFDARLATLESMLAEVVGFQSKLLPLLAEMEADMQQLARGSGSSGKTPRAKGTRRKAS